jgi:hypothetical protein
MLKAGYLEEWKLNPTLSGTPQGGIVSPILSNIYLDQLDQFVETTLLPAYDRGTKRRESKEYKRYKRQYYNAVKRGNHTQAKELRQKLQSTPSSDTHDPDYRRLRYVRYADDFLLGFAGPHQEAEEIKRQIGEYLRDNLKLKLSEDKTLITHARSETAKFLGYEVTVLHNDRVHTKGHRSINGAIGLKVPLTVIRAKCSTYMQGNKPVHRTEMTDDTVYSIISHYQAEYRGIIEYYRMAYNLHRFQQLKWVMETSLTKTLASKLKISVNKVYEKYGTLIETNHTPMKGLQVKMEREGKKPLVATWGGITLRWRPKAILNDAPPPVWNTDRSEISQRLLADTCELCGSHLNVEMHHVKGLKNLKVKGRKPKPRWMTVMASRRRKSLPVCRTCHDDIHAGDLARRRKIRRPRTSKAGTGEPDDAKVSSPVRRGADGKVPD